MSLAAAAAAAGCTLHVHLVSYYGAAPEAVETAENKPPAASQPSARMDLADVLKQIEKGDIP